MNKWCIIVPFRNRNEHLEKFSQHYKSAFPNVPIYVIEQDDEKGFNRGKLLNVGFLETKDLYDYFCFHDVDMLANTFESYIVYPDKPTHLATECSQFGYTLPYMEYFGGVNMFNRIDFEYVNGYSNELFHWGIEDDDLRNRVLDNGIFINHKSVRYECFDHERPMNHKIYHQNLIKFKTGQLSRSSGLSDCSYEVTHVGKLLDCIHIKVKL